MKQIITIWFGLLSLLLIQSCESTIDQAETYGSVKFSIAINGIDSVKNISTDSVDYKSYGIILSIKNRQGDIIHENYYLPLLRFGNGYISSKIELLTGQYNLTKFIIVDTQGNIIYAAPYEYSPKAYLVIDALPIQFTVFEDKNTTISPEIFPTGNANPEDFGYASFQINIVNTITLYSSVRYYNPLSMSIHPYVNTSAIVNIQSKEWSHCYIFDSGLNRILIRDLGGDYLFRVMTSDNDSILFTFSADELKNTSATNPLYLDIDNSNTQLKTLEIQPAPREGKDATITDLEPYSNYGNEPIWHCQFMTEDILTVMRTTRSMIYFNLNVLPKSARIKKVYLNLFITNWNNLPKLDETGNQLISWGAVLRQITESWFEDSVNWINQPATITANQVFIDYHPELAFNGRLYDVTSLFVPMQEIAAPNYGMMLMPSSDSLLPPVYFASSDNHTPSMRPKLIIKYTLE